MNNRPMQHYDGISKPSSRNLPDETGIGSPSFAMLSFILAGKGTTAPVAMRLQSAVAEFGSDFLETYSPHYQHQSKYLKRALTVNGAAIIKRITLPNAKKARLSLCIEHVPADVLRDGVWERGSKIIWHVRPTTEFGEGAIVNNFRQGSITNERDQPLGMYTDDSDVNHFSTSTLYPAIDFELAWVGSAGNKFKVDITTDNNIGNIESTDFRPFYFRLVEDLQYLAKTYTNRDGDEVTPFSFDKGFYDDSYGLGFDIEDVLAKRYIGGATSPIGRVHVYRDELNTLRDKLIKGYTHQGLHFKGEAEGDQYSNIDILHPIDDPRNRPLFNLIDVKDRDGFDYNYVDLAGSEFGGLDLGIGASVAFYGGDDAYPVTAGGSIDKLELLRLYDLEVRKELLSFASKNHPYLNMVRLPFTVWYDSGYSMDTKIAAFNIKATRPEVVLKFTTFSVADYTDVIVDPPNPPFVISCVNASNDAALRITAGGTYDLIINGVAVLTGLTLNQLMYEIQTNYAAEFEFQLLEAPEEEY